MVDQLVSNIPYAAAVEGGTAQAGEINQFLVDHAAVYCYQPAHAHGQTVRPRYVTAASQSPLFTAQGFIPTASTNISAIYLPTQLATAKFDCDLSVYVVPDASGTGTYSHPALTPILGQTILPYAILDQISGTSASGSVTYALPMGFTAPVTAGNAYWVVIAPNGVYNAAGAIPAASPYKLDVLTPPGSGAWSGPVAPWTSSSDGNTWATLSSTLGHYVAICPMISTAVKNAGVLPFTICEDSGAQWQSFYLTTTQLGVGFGAPSPKFVTVTAHLATDPVNYLSYSDAIFQENWSPAFGTDTIGHWLATGATLAAGNGVLTATATGSTITLTCPNYTMLNATGVTVPMTMAAVLSAVTVPRTVTVTMAGLGANSGAAVDSASAPTLITSSVTVPNGAPTSVTPTITIASTVPGEQHEITGVGLYQQGAMGAFVAPGLGIASRRTPTLDSQGRLLTLY